MHLIVLLCDVNQAEADFDLFGDSFNLGARKVHGLCLMYHGHRNRFGHTRWYSYVMYVMWKLVLDHLEKVLSRRKIGARFAPNVQRAWKSFWAHPMGLLGDMCRVEGRFGPFGDSVSLGARSVYDLRRMYQRHGNLFRHTRWYS
jgi:hypothetical protein